MHGEVRSCPWQRWRPYRCVRSRSDEVWWWLSAASPRRRRRTSPTPSSRCARCIAIWYRAQYQGQYVDCWSEETALVLCLQARYRPVGIDGKLKDLWVEVAAQTSRDAEAAALITKETGVADVDKLARAAAARLTPEWDRSSRNGGPSACRWCGVSFGLTVWQYNCSACGWKVCGECSPNAMELTQWLEGHKPHELRRVPSNARLRVCVGCWYAAQATAQKSSALTVSSVDGSDHAAAVKQLLLLDHESLRTTLSELSREDLLLLVCTAVDAASQRATDNDGSTEFLAEVSTRLVSCSDAPDSPQPALRQSRPRTPPTATGAAAGAGAAAAVAARISTAGLDEDRDDLPLPSPHSSSARELGAM
eukprot:COSAG02_NODE_1383_length_12965_cov_60.828463_6_plen_364_part_00